MSTQGVALEANMHKLLVICGPTATGKTSTGIQLAKRFNGEVVSADSRQVYRGMDIITGKDLPEFSIFNFKFSNEKGQQAGYYLFDDVPVWLLDVVDPDQKFNVADYCNLAWRAIQDIWNRKKLPIVVGGTGFYIKALTEGIGTIGIEPDLELRKKLSNYSVNELANYLKKIDSSKFESMNQSDKNNPRRLVRAIEVAMNKEPQIVDWKLPDFNVKVIGLTTPHEVLCQRIDQRVDERVRTGAEEEVKKLINRGYDWENSVMEQTIGYREWRDFFENNVSKEKIIEKWKFDEHGYARRQMTWFRKMKNIHWFNVAIKGFESKVEKLIQSWYI